MATQIKATTITRCESIMLLLLLLLLFCYKMYANVWLPKFFPGDFNHVFLKFAYANRIDAKFNRKNILKWLQVNNWIQKGKRQENNILSSEKINSIQRFGCKTRG